MRSLFLTLALALIAAAQPYSAPCGPSGCVSGPITLGTTYLSNVMPGEMPGSRTNLLTLRANLASALNNGNLATIAVFGTSISQGSGASSNAVSWSAQLVGELQSRFGNGGPGFISTEGGPSGSLTPTGSWTGIAFGPNQTGTNAFQEVKQGATNATYAVSFGPVDTLDVIYYGVAGGLSTSCSATVTGTGGSTQTFGAADAVFHIFTFTSLSKSVNHSITITSADGNCAIFGVNARYSGGGATLFNVARSGARSDAFASAAQLSWLSLVPGLSAIIIELGQNDPAVDTQAQSLANIQAILTQNAGLTAPVPVLFLLPELPSSDGGQAALYAAEKGLAQTNGFGWVSIGDRWGSFTAGNALGLYADTIHPSQAGHNDIASALDLYLGLMPGNSGRSAFYPTLANGIAGTISGGLTSGIHEQYDGSAARYIFDGYNAPGFTLKHLNTPGTVFTTQINGNGGAQMTDTAGIAINGLTINSSVAFASLGTPSNGVILYCTDCTIANPCASGGTGAIAKRLNGVWVCN